MGTIATLEKIQAHHTIPTNGVCIERRSHVNQYNAIQPFTEQEKQWWCVNKLCLYYGKPSHIASNCPKKQM